MSVPSNYENLIKRRSYALAQETSVLRDNGVGSTKFVPVQSSGTLTNGKSLHRNLSNIDENAKQFINKSPPTKKKYDQNYLEHNKRLSTFESIQNALRKAVSPKDHQIVESHNRGTSPSRIPISSSRGTSPIPQKSRGVSPSRIPTSNSRRDSVPRGTSPVQSRSRGVSPSRIPTATSRDSVPRGTSPSRSRGVSPSRIPTTNSRRDSVPRGTSPNQSRSRGVSPSRIPTSNSRRDQVPRGTSPIQSKSRGVSPSRIPTSNSRRDSAPHETSPTQSRSRGVSPSRIPISLSRGTSPTPKRSRGISPSRMPSSNSQRDILNTNLLPHQSRPHGASPNTAFQRSPNPQSVYTTNLPNANKNREISPNRYPYSSASKEQLDHVYTPYAGSNDNNYLTIKRHPQINSIRTQSSATETNTRGGNYLQSSPPSNMMSKYNLKPISQTASVNKPNQTMSYFETDFNASSSPKNHRNNNNSHSHFNAQQQKFDRHSYQNDGKLSFSSESGSSLGIIDIPIESSNTSLIDLVSSPDDLIYARNQPYTESTSESSLTGAALNNDHKNFYKLNSNLKAQNSITPLSIYQPSAQNGYQRSNYKANSNQNNQKITGNCAKNIRPKGNGRTPKSSITKPIVVSKSLNNLMGFNSRQLLENNDLNSTTSVSTYPSTVSLSSYTRGNQQYESDYVSIETYNPVFDCPPCYTPPPPPRVNDSLFDSKPSTNERQLQNYSLAGSQSSPNIVSILSFAVHETIDTESDSDKNQDTINDVNYIRQRSMELYGKNGQLHKSYENMNSLVHESRSKGFKVQQNYNGFQKKNSHNKSKERLNESKYTSNQNKQTPNTTSNFREQPQPRPRQLFLPELQTSANRTRQDNRQQHSQYLQQSTDNSLNQQSAFNNNDVDTLTSPQQQAQLLSQPMQRQRHLNQLQQCHGQQQIDAPYGPRDYYHSSALGSSNDVTNSGALSTDVNNSSSNVMKINEQTSYKKNSYHTDKNNVDIPTILRGKPDFSVSAIGEGERGQQDRTQSTLGVSTTGDTIGLTSSAKAWPELTGNTHNDRVHNPSSQSAFDNCAVEEKNLKNKILAPCSNKEPVRNLDPKSRNECYWLKQSDNNLKFVAKGESGSRISTTDNFGEGISNSNNRKDKVSIDEFSNSRINLRKQIENTQADRKNFFNCISEGPKTAHKISGCDNEAYELDQLSSEQLENEKINTTDSENSKVLLDKLKYIEDNQCRELGITNDALKSSPGIIIGANSNLNNSKPASYSDPASNSRRVTIFDEDIIYAKETLKNKNSIPSEPYSDIPNVNTSNPVLGRRQAVKYRTAAGPRAGGELLNASQGREPLTGSTDRYSSQPSHGNCTTHSDSEGPNTISSDSVPSVFSKSNNAVENNNADSLTITGLSCMDPDGKLTNSSIKTAPEAYKLEAINVNSSHNKSTGVNRDRPHQLNELCAPNVGQNMDGQGKYITDSSSINSSNASSPIMDKLKFAQQLSNTDGIDNENFAVEVIPSITVNGRNSISMNTSESGFSSNFLDQSTESVNQTLSSIDPSSTAPIDLMQMRLSLLKQKETKFTPENALTKQGGKNLLENKDQHSNAIKRSRRKHSTENNAKQQSENNANHDKNKPANDKKKTSENNKNQSSENNKNQPSENNTKNSSENKNSAKLPLSSKFSRKETSIHSKLEQIKNVSTSSLLKKKMSMFSGKKNVKHPGLIDVSERPLVTNPISINGIHTQTYAIRFYILGLFAAIAMMQVSFWLR